jgi:hypothetical protein
MNYKFAVPMDMGFERSFAGIGPVCYYPVRSGLWIVGSARDCGWKPLGFDVFLGSRSTRIDILCRRR